MAGGAGAQPRQDSRAEGADGDVRVPEEDGREEERLYLRSDDGARAVEGKSMGRWLRQSDFVVALEDGIRTGVSSSFEIGPHHFPEDVGGLYKTSRVFRSLVSSSGPLAPTALRCVSGSPVPQTDLPSSCSVWPLQSFANAEAIEATAGLRVVKGWAVYELFDWPPGRGFVAERYWWNADGQCRWLDFTPRPESSPLLLLAQSARPAEAPLTALAYRERLLADSLFCHRFPGAWATQQVAQGAPGALCRVLQAAEEASTEDDGGGGPGGGFCRGLLAAGMAAVLTGRLASAAAGLAAGGAEGAAPQELRLLGVLAKQAAADGAGPAAAGPMLPAGGVETLVKLLSAPSGVACAASSVLAAICENSQEARALSLAAGAAPALAALFGGGAAEDGRHPRVDGLACWQALGEPAAAAPAAPAAAPPAEHHWEQLRGGRLRELEEAHRREAPRERRGHSWARALAFGQVELGARGRLVGAGGVTVRRGTEDQPFVIWVLGARASVERNLAVGGFFKDANWVERAPTEVVLVGEGLGQLHLASGLREGDPPAVRSACYEEIWWRRRLGCGGPDLAVVFMPGAAGASRELPEHVLAAVAGVPALVTVRYELGEGHAMELRRKVGRHLVLKQVPCPFSSTAGMPESTLGDNSWAFAVQGPGALAEALATEATLARGPQARRHGPGRAKCVFWGILDIKYDTSRPVLERVKVLETGDGRTSKFSGDGAPIKARYQERYQLDQDENLNFNKFISEDKKLTHDLAVESGYGHLVPEQVCFPREYRDDLWRDIRDGLGIGDGSHVVLKLCNRSRAAGVLVVTVRELDETLQRLLVVPQEAELDRWLGPLAERMLDGPGVDLGCEAQSFEEQRRHWWSNESPVFVAERLCTSVPCESGERSYDATMRVGFALRRRPAGDGGPPAGGPDELAADWLGGYWKLPASPLGDGFSRSSCISAARTAGTAPVPAEHLHEVFAALGDAVQQLFSSREPGPEDLRTVHAQRHGHGRELTAFFTARLGTSCFQRNPAKALRMLEDALQLLDGAAEPAPCERYVRSFVHRSMGCVAAAEEERPDQLLRAAALHPCSANALFWLGASALQVGAEQLEEAHARLGRSLLLDPDFRPAYVCLAVVCIKRGLLEEAVRLSEACLARHPQTPMCHYHIAVACCQQALQLRAAAAAAGAGAAGLAEEAERLRRRSLEAFSLALDSEEARRRSRAAAGPGASAEPPWTEADAQMRLTMEGTVHPKKVPLPATWPGWPVYAYRM